MPLEIGKKLDLIALFRLQPFGISDCSSACCSSMDSSSLAPALRRDFPEINYV